MDDGASLLSLLGKGASAGLARKLGEPQHTETGEIYLELYWKGMRDHLYRDRTKDDSNDFADCYERLFPDLRKRIALSGSFRPLNNLNYDISTEEGKTGLRNNLVNTEVDIVLESPSCLYIGEAKHEMSFGADGQLVLVHQLIRQYVMAKILVDHLKRKKEVVPFVIGDDTKKLMRNGQVDFMIRQGWLKEANVLEWSEVKDLARHN